jgi:outer membrane protein OmpA-like peptidoglycan-associated protein
LIFADRYREQMSRERTTDRAEPERAAPVARPAAARPGDLIRLAAAAGNRAMTRLMRSGDTDGGAGGAPPGFAAQLRVADGGQPIPAGARESLEAGLGVPLDTVRLHVGAGSAAMSDQVAADAFTVGQDVHFARGSYDPDSARGYHLLAHEVVHTLQPETGAPAGSLTVGPGDAPAECEAEAVASRLTRQRHATDPPVTGPAPTGVAGPSTVRRFGRQEHHDLGDAAKADIDLGGGLILSWGDVVSLAGDEYGSVEELQAAAATPAGRAELRQIMASDDNHSPQYVDLAMHNVSHFAGGGTAMASWSSHHETALLTALLAGLGDSEPQWQHAQLTEAFGQHFLTDSFSAGHIRTPRAEIIAWYQGDFAPRALPPTIAYARNWLRTELIKQLDPQLTAPGFVIGWMVDRAMDGALWWFADEIRDKMQPLFGLGISGAISGALHDRDNERGLWVASEAHPEPWQAFGDGRLVCSPTSRDQAELAVITAREQVVLAQDLGRIRREQRGVQPVTSRPDHEVPGAVHFALDSADLDGPGAIALDRAAEFLTAHSEQVLDISGHTDPLGTDAYNDALGMRRAQSVAARLMLRGIAADRLHLASAGERQLLSSEKAGYPSDRRAELAYRAAGDAPDDLVWARQILAERTPGPPYAEVERYVPHEVPALNDPQEDWHWGTLTSEMAAEIDRWIKSYVGDAVAKAAADPRLKDVEVPVLDLWFSGPVVSTATLRPRQPVLDLLNQLVADGTGFVAQMVGIPAANRSVPPSPPAVRCP